MKLSDFESCIRYSHRVRRITPSNIFTYDISCELSDILSILAISRLFLGTCLRSVTFDLVAKPELPGIVLALSNLQNSCANLTNFRLTSSTRDLTFTTESSGVICEFICQFQTLPRIRIPHAPALIRHVLVDTSRMVSNVGSSNARHHFQSPAHWFLFPHCSGRKLLPVFSAKLHLCYRSF